MRLCLSRDDRSTFSFDSVGNGFDRGNQHAASRILVQIGDGRFDFGEHGAGFELSLNDQFFSLGSGQCVQRLLF